MNKSQYIAAASPAAFERERLRLLGEMADPITIRRMQYLKIQPGWRCLEVGAGNGSIARWMSAHVGPDGKVVATDINTRFLIELGEPNLEVRQHDILNDPLETSQYDLVHCRAVLMHLSDPQRALQKMAAAVRPGGWLFIEEGDYISYAAVDADHPAAAPFNRGGRAIIEAMAAESILAPYFGRQVPGLLTLLGFQDVGHDGTTWVNRGGDAGAQFMQMGLKLVKPRMVAAGVLMEADFDEIDRMCSDPAFQFVDLTFFGAWGRRPTQPLLELERGLRGNLKV